MQVDRKEDEAVEEGEEDSSWVDVVRPKAASPKNLSHSPTLARMATGGDAGNDSEPVTEDEPVTEEEEPLTEDEDVEMAPAPASISIENPLGDFARVLRARGAEVAVKGLVEAAEMLVARSFSTANYALAMQCLQEARRTASVSRLLCCWGVGLMVWTQRRKCRRSTTTPFARSFARRSSRWL